MCTTLCVCVSVSVAINGKLLGASAAHGAQLTASIFNVVVNVDINAASSLC